MTTHPAKFSAPIVDELRDIVAAEAERLGRRPRLLDPFAGVGGIHALDDLADTVGVELEPEWAKAHDRTEVGDATDLLFDEASFDIVATSPCYGNRMADTYDGRDGSRRMTYRLALGRALTDGSAAAMQWGPAYRALHRRAWTEALRVLRPDGLLAINVSNHVRAGQVQRVVEWHLGVVLDLGALLVEARPIGTARMRHGANHDLRVDAEHLLVVRAPQIAPVPTLLLEEAVG